VAADRAAYGARQAELLQALLRGGDFPAGFAPAQAQTAARSLRRKRVRSVRRTWPALAIALGESFDERFDAFADAVSPPAFGEGLTDGLAFASTLSRGELSDDARVEMLFARTEVRRGRDGQWRRRGGTFAGATRLRDPHGLLVAVRVPGLGRRAGVFRLPG